MSSTVSFARFLLITGALALVAPGCRAVQFGRARSADCTTGVEPGLAHVEPNEHHSFDRPFPAPPTSPREEPDSPLRADSPDDASHSESADATTSGDSFQAPDPEVVASRLEARGALLTRDAFQSVVTMDLSNTGVIDEDLENIGLFQDLKQLNLAGTRVSNTCLDYLVPFRQLEFLGLMGTQVDDEGVRTIVKLRHLRFLSLAGTAVSDAGLISLSRMRTLEAVNLRATRVTPDGVAALQAGLPNCRIVFDAGLDTDQPPPAPAPRDDAPATDAETSWRRNDGLPARPPGALFDLPRLYPQPERIEAQHQLELVLRRKLSDPDVLHALASVRASEGHWREAETTIRAALQQRPADRGLRFDHAVTLAMCRELDAAFEQFERAVGRPAAHYNLGVLLVEQQRPTDARAHFQQAIALDPTLDSAREWLAFVNDDGRQAPHDQRRPGLLTDQQFQSDFGSLLGADAPLRDELEIRSAQASSRVNPDPRISPFSAALTPIWSSAAAPGR